jgi:hypothetical protein
LGSKHPMPYGHFSQKYGLNPNNYRNLPEQLRRSVALQQHHGKLDQDPP